MSVVVSIRLQRTFLRAHLELKRTDGSTARGVVMSLVAICWQVDQLTNGRLACDAVAVSAAR